MNTQITTHIDPEAIEKLMLNGDLKALTTDQRIQYYNLKCEHLGLDPTARPFEYMMLQGKLTLYATKECAAQLREKHHVSIGDMETKEVEGIFICTVTASLPSGRSDTDVGCVPVDGLKGDRRGNAMLKAITKAKRRVTLSLLGLGMLDETEVETIPNVKRVTDEEALQISDSNDQEAANAAAEIEDDIDQVVIQKAEVIGMSCKEVGSKSWWSVQINHACQEFFTDNERFAETVQDCIQDKQMICAVLDVSSRADGRVAYLASDVDLYEGVQDA